MRAKSMVLLLIAGVCGLVASIGISQVIERRGQGAAEIPMGELFVAVADIDIGAKLDATNVKLDKWPKDRIPEGSITKLEEIKDRYPRVRLYAGEPILTAKLMDSKDGVDQATKIPEGYRVVSVKVTMDEVVSGLVRPGDRVDVVLFLRKSNDIKQTMAHTFLKDVRVFAINAETERAKDTEGEEMVAKTVSLLVKPNQVESVMLASELGKMRLSLRRPNDPKTYDDDDGTDIDELLNSKDKIADDKTAAERNKEQGGIFDVLSKQAPAAVVQPTPELAPAFEAAKPQWQMTIISPAGNSKFEWNDPKGLPTEVTNGGSGGSISPPSVLPPAVTPPGLNAPATAPVTAPEIAPEFGQDANASGSE